ncbi:MAG: hypothetical protein ACRCU3_01865 [Eubacteriaceae bacterium]
MNDENKRIHNVTNKINEFVSKCNNENIEIAVEQLKSTVSLYNELSDREKSLVTNSKQLMNKQIELKGLWELRKGEINKNENEKLEKENKLINLESKEKKHLYDDEEKEEREKTPKYIPPFKGEINPYVEKRREYKEKRNENFNNWEKDQKNLLVIENTIQDQLTVFRESYLSSSENEGKKSFQGALSPYVREEVAIENEDTGILFNLSASPLPQKEGIVEKYKTEKKVKKYIFGSKKAKIEANYRKGYDGYYDSHQQYEDEVVGKEKDFIRMAKIAGLSLLFVILVVISINLMLS